jgi:2-C-methyl-D-erythritol 4-phosphate cytidylyltransferase
MQPATVPRFYALVPCAGIGERAGQAGPKQYVELAGRMLVAHTLSALAQVDRLHMTLVVLSPRDEGFETHVPLFDGAVARVGGPTRAITVSRGLDALAAGGARPDDWVLVHDAARCLVRPAWVNALIDACENDAVGGLLACPVADTLKEAQDGRAVSTLARTAKWQAQTPQMFRLGLLQDALSRAPLDVSDEASAVEALGLSPKLVSCSLENFKLTFAADFELAERLLRGRD